MEEMAAKAPCEALKSSVPSQSRCQNCFHPEERHRAKHQPAPLGFPLPRLVPPPRPRVRPGRAAERGPESEPPGDEGADSRQLPPLPLERAAQEPGSPPSAEAPYCDLPCCPPAPEDTLSTATSTCRPVVGPGLKQGPERDSSCTAGLSEEGPKAILGSGRGDLEAVLYLESPASSLCDSCDKSPSFDTSSGPNSDTPDDTSNSSSVDWHVIEGWDEVPSQDELTVMIPRRTQEGPRADSARRVTKSPVRGDAAGQRKEDTRSGSRSTGQHWKLRGESGYFLERHRSLPTQASSETPQSGPRSATHQVSSAQRDIAQAPSTQELLRASSPHRITQKDNARTSSTRWDTPRALSTQQNTPRMSSPSRVSHNPRTSPPQQNNPQLSSLLGATQQDSQRTPSTQQDNLPSSFPTCPPQRETPRISCAQKDNARATSPNRATQRETPKASCPQWDNPRTSSPNRAPQKENSRTSCAQRDNPRASSPNRTSQRENSRTSCAQRDNARASSPNRTSQRENSRTSCAQRDNARASSPNRTSQRENSRTSSAQRDNPRASSPNRTSQRENSRTSCAQRDNPRASSPNRTSQRENSRTSCAQRDNARASSPNRTSQRENSRTSCAQRDNPRASSPNRTSQRENSRTSCAQRDNARASSPNRTSQRENSRTSCAQRDNPRASSPNRASQRENSRTSCAQRDNPRASSPNRASQRENLRTSCAQWDNPRSSPPGRRSQKENLRTSCIQQNTSKTSSTHRDNPKPSCSRWEHLRSTCTQRDSSHCSSHQRDGPGTSSPQRCPQRDNPGPPSPRHTTQRSNPRNPSPHQTNKDIPWASFPLRPTPSDGARTSSPSRSKQSEVPWASIALRPTQGDRPRTSSPTRPGQRDTPQSSCAPVQHNAPPQAASSSHNPGHLSASRTSSPLYAVTRGTPQTSSEPCQPPYAVCIGHRDAPRASSPPRYLQHDPFPFFPEPRAPESESSHHDPPYMPPAVCIGHRDAPRASSPPRYTQFDPFPFLPDTSDTENESECPQHDPPHFPPPVCIGYRDAPRASSPPRQFPEPSFLFQDLPRASTESLVPSMDSLHERPRTPTSVCIGHRDAPSFSSPPRQAPEPSLFFQEPPGAGMDSLASSTDSLHGCPPLPPQVCIGHRDAPRASSPPRHPPTDLALLAPSPPPGSSRGPRGSAPPGETRHNLEREEYTVLADLPPPRRLAQRDPAPQAQGSDGGRTRSPGRTEVERLFGQERRKSGTPGTFQAQDEGWSPRPSQGQSQPLRRQPSPAAGRQVTKAPAKQAEWTRRSPAEPPRSRSLERQPEGDQWQQRSSPPPRTSARPPERELLRTEKAPERDRGGPRQPLVGWQSQQELPGSQVPHRHLERSWSSQEEGPSPGGWPGLWEPSLGTARALEGAWQGLPRENRDSWGRPEAWEEPPSNGLQECPQKPAPRGWSSLQELSFPPKPGSPPEHSWVGLEESSHPQRPEMPTAMGRGPERPPELDWRDLLGLFRAPGEGAWARLPRLDWEGLLELLQARLPHKDPAGHGGDPASGPQPGPPGTKDDVLEQERHSQPGGCAEATVANGHSPGKQPQIPAQPSPACTSTQWPKNQETSGLVTSSLPGRQQTVRLEHSRPAEGPSLPEPEVQPEEPEASEPSRGQDSLTEQEQADSPDLLNFKKGWMSILDEPGEWKKHWFVLTDSSLKYYRDSTAEEADELDGEIDLRSCTDVTEYAVQRNYGFQIHTKDAVYTLSAMTSGIRRNWIEALRKTVRPTSAPDVTKLSDCNKENTLHGYGPQKGSLKAGEQRAGSEVGGRSGPRKADGPRQSLDYVELSPLTQGGPQRACTPAKQEELERDLAQRSEERRKWFEATDSRAPETGEAPRRGLGAPLTEDQQSRLSEEIEKKWQELEKLPLRDNKRVPLTALLNQGRSERRAPPSNTHEALEKEVQSLRAQLEAWRVRGEAPQSTPRPQDNSHIPPGYISQEACERGLAEMETSHQQAMEQLQRHHERELQRMQQEKEQLLAEETAATASAIEAMKKAYQEELNRELSKTRSLQQGPDGLRKQHQSDVEALKRELQVLSEQYSQKCLEIGALTRQAEEREHKLRRCQQEGQELLRHNQELHARLSEEIDRLRSFVASKGTSNSCGRGGERSSCELEVLLRVKENELQYLKKEVQCLRDELQTMQKDKRFTSGKYQDVYVELNHIKTRSEQEIEQLKEHLRLAMAALQEKEGTRNSLAE